MRCHLQHKFHRHIFIAYFLHFLQPTSSTTPRTSSIFSFRLARSAAYLLPKLTNHYKCSRRGHFWIRIELSKWLVCLRERDRAFCEQKNTDWWQHWFGILRKRTQIADKLDKFYIVFFNWPIEKIGVGYRGNVNACFTPIPIYNIHCQIWFTTTMT